MPQESFLTFFKIIQKLSELHRQILDFACSKDVCLLTRVRLLTRSIGLRFSRVLRFRLAVAGRRISRLLWLAVGLYFRKSGSMNGLLVPRHAVKHVLSDLLGVRRLVLLVDHVWDSLLFQELLLYLVFG